MGFQEPRICRKQQSWVLYSAKMACTARTLGPLGRSGCIADSVPTAGSKYRWRVIAAAHGPLRGGGAWSWCHCLGRKTDTAVFERTVTPSPCPPRTSERDLLGQGDPQSNDRCPCKRQKRRQMQRRRHVRTEAEMGGMWSPAQGRREPQKLEEARRTLPRSLRREPSPAPPGSQQPCPAWISDWSPELGGNESWWV